MATTNLGRVKGLSAYEVAVQNGYVGTEEQWLASLQGEAGTTDYNDLENKPDLSNYAAKNSNNNFSASQTVNGTFTVNGDIVQNGQSYETHAEQLYTEKDEIITRDGAVGGLAVGVLTGIKGHKYDGTNDGQLGFDANGEARVGDVGDTQPLLTRDEMTNLADGHLLKWDGTNFRAVDGGLIWRGTQTEYEALPIAQQNAILLAVIIE